MFKKNTAVGGFPIGNFISTTDGSTVTAGVPTCKRTLDGTAGACANAAAYDATGLLWKIDLTAADMNGDMVGLSFTLAGCMPINYAIKTNTKLVSDLNDIAAATAQDLQTIKGQAVTAAAGVTFPASIGTSTYAGGAVASVTAPVTVGTNSDKTGYSLTGTKTTLDSLTEPPTAVAIATQVNSTLSSAHGAGLWGGAAGAGAITFTYTLTSTVGGTAIADADVWVTSDVAGTAILASGKTNASGQVVFYLDAGTVYVWRQKSGWNFTNPDTEVVA